MAAFPVTATINFLLLLVILYVVLRKRVPQALQENHDHWQRDIEAAQKLKDNAQALLDDVESKTAHLEQQVEALLQEARLQAEQEKAAILQRAEILSQRILDDARKHAQLEVRRAHDMVGKTIIQQAIDQTQVVLAQRLTSDDHDAMCEHFLGELETSSTTKHV